MLALISEEQKQNQKGNERDLVELEEVSLSLDKPNENAPDKNVGQLQREGITARFIGFIIIALGATFGLLSVGMCALWCRRQYKDAFYDDLRQRDSFNDLTSG